MKQVFIIMMLFSTTLLLALSGAYTVGGATADYTTLTAAINAANTEGLSGNTEFILNPGTYNGPYVLQHDNNGFELKLTRGSAPAGSVVLNNPTATTDTNYIIKINAVSKVNIQGLRFETSGSFNRAIHLEDNADYTSITSCSFQGAIGASSNNSGFINIASSGSGDADYLYIALNGFFNGGYHIAVNSSSYNDLFSNWEIFNNYFGEGHTGLYLTRFSNLILSTNTLEDMNNAFNLSNGSGSLEISGNRITNCSTGLLGSYLASNTTTPHIFNNIISVTGEYGLSVYGTNLLILHNSVINSASESYNRFSASIAGSGNQVKKNHFICSGGGIALGASSVDPTSSQRNIIEHNNIYSFGVNVAKISNDSYKELSQYNAYTQTQNVSYNPFFEGLFLSTSSAYMDNLYPSTAVTVDFNGFARSLTNSDIGAHEYSAAAGQTPMSGTYTIGTPGDFASIQEFCTALSTRGVSAAVNGNLTQSSYEEQVILHAVPGASDTNLITLRSVITGNSTLSYSAQTAAAPYVMQLIRTSYIKLSNIYFSTTASSHLLLLSGYNQDFAMQYCRFDAPANTNYISLGAQYGSEAKNVDIFSGRFTGNGYGVSAYGTNWRVYGSTFDNQYTSVYAQSILGFDVENSTFTNSRYNNINISSALNINILHNRITGTKTGINLHTYGTTATRSLVANNTVKLNGGGANGIYISGNMISVLNNSVEAKGQTTKALYLYEMGSDVDIVNNILTSDIGHALDIGYFTPAASKVVDYNCYYTEGSLFVKMGTEYGSFSALQAALPNSNQHSVSVNPHFSEDMHTGSQWVRQIGMFRTEITTDMDFEPRGSLFDIGADQQTGEIIDNRLAGTYTIGSLGCDYPDLSEAIADLELNGISANVTFNITLGTYPGLNEIHEFPKADSNLHVYFNALNGVNFSMLPENTYSYQNYFFRLVGTKNIHFNGINMALLPNSRQSTFFVLDGRCEGVSISSSHFNMTNTQSSNNTALSTGDFQGSDLLISDCTFTGGGTGIYIPGYYWATLSYTDVDIQDCTFTNVSIPISIQKAVNLKISGNQMTGATTAISLSSVTGVSEISGNKILSSGYAGSYSSGTVVNLSSCSGAIYNAFRIVNNIIVANQSSAQSVIALSMYSCSHFYVNHNTIVSDNNTYNEYGGALGLSSVSFTSFWNNVFSAPSSGYAVTAQNFTDSYFQNNAWYSSAKNLANISSTLYSAEDFLALMDPSGYYANPLTDANGYNQCGYLRNKAASSASIADIDNTLWNGTPDLGANTITDAGSPLSGTIYVGAYEAYPNLASAWDALQKRGISGNVTLQLSPGEMQTSLQMGYVPNSLLYTVTINGAGGQNAPILKKTASSEADNYILKLYNTRNLILSNLAFSSGNAAYSKAIELQRYIKDLQIDNCSFSTSTGNQSSSYSAALYGSGVIIENIAFTNNYIGNLPYGINLSGSQMANMVNGGLSISGNTMQNNYSGIYLSYIAAPQISNNIIRDTRYNAITLSSGVSNSFVAANQLSGNGYQGLVLSSLSGTNYVVNNYITTGPNVTTSLYVNSSPNVKVYHNTIINSSSSSSSAAFAHTASSAGLAFRNNICKAASGYAAMFNALLDFEAGLYTHNLYNSTGSNTVKLGSTNINSSLAWNQNTGDQYSIFADPLLATNSFELTAGSSARYAGILVGSVTSDIMGVVRSNPPSIGCRESNISVLETPENLQISVSEAMQTVTLSWDTVPGAGIYFVQTATDPYAQSWSDIPGASTGQLSITIPVSGTYRFYRIRAMGPD